MLSPSAGNCSILWSMCSTSVPAEEKCTQMDINICHTLALNVTPLSSAQHGGLISSAQIELNENNTQIILKH